MRKDIAKWDLRLIHFSTIRLNYGRKSLVDIETWSHILQCSLLRAKHWEESLWFQWARFTSQDDATHDRQVKNKDSWTNRKQALHNEVSAKQLPEGVGHRLLWEEFGVQGSIGIYRNRPDLSKHSKHSKHPMQAFTYQILQNLVCNIHKQGIVCLLQCSKEYVYYVLITLCKHVYIYM